MHVKNEWFHAPITKTEVQDGPGMEKAVAVEFPRESQRTQVCAGQSLCREKSYFPEINLLNESYVEVSAPIKRQA
ncbi:hypothetical protein TNIN_319701 [Trichonephila inaurata madagascariensis]|uniref:Uncharacterized protein n=1 Tax=Trichonephila inaurata madagascariensis TaxID=2747483 RepID=A0A8X7C0Y2_9ARAC|nr:hypothetical protein TNIN_319701 [Trichonephila inaurata madagascariensis]